MGASTGQALVWNGTSWAPSSVSSGSTTVSNTVNGFQFTTTVNGVTSNPVSLPFAADGVAGLIALSCDLTGTVWCPRVANNAITSAKIQNSTIINEDLSSSSVSSDNIIDGTIITQDIANSQITFGKMQNISGIRLLGNPNSSVGPISEIQIGSGLSLSGNTLNVTSISSTNKKMVLSAEYAGAVIVPGSGSNHTGDLIGGNTGNNWPYYMNYYEWKGRASGDQTYQIIVRLTLPSDFSSWQSSNPFQINYMVTNSNCEISYIIKNVSNNNTIYTSPLLDNTSWTTHSLTTANISSWTSSVQAVAIIITLSCTNNNYARIGDIVLNYQ